MSQYRSRRRGFAIDRVTRTNCPHTPFANDLLFHEPVHVKQYLRLGISTFASLYVRGFLKRGGYKGIPLERNAYLLGDRYAQNRGSSFAAADEVATWIADERF